MKEKKLRTILVDDEEKALNNLESMLKECPGIQIIDRFTDPEKALGKILVHKPDLLFLDIQMPGMTGFDLVSGIYRGGLKPNIIFVTAFDQYAIDAIRHAAFDFLLKPVNMQELENAMKRLMEKTTESVHEQRFKALIDKTSKRGIKLANAGGFILLKPEDILYILADWNYSEIWLDKERKEVVSMNIGSVEDLLPEEDFYRITRSMIINVNYLSKVIRKKRIAILVKDGQEYTLDIPVLKIRGLERFLENF